MGAAHSRLQPSAMSAGTEPPRYHLGNSIPLTQNCNVQSCEVKSDAWASRHRIISMGIMTTSSQKLSTPQVMSWRSLIYAKRKDPSTGQIMKKCRRSGRNCQYRSLIQQRPHGQCPCLPSFSLLVHVRWHASTSLGGPKGRERGIAELARDKEDAVLAMAGRGKYCRHAMLLPRLRSALSSKLDGVQYSSTHASVMWPRRPCRALSDAAETSVGYIHIASMWKAYWSFGQSMLMWLAYTIDACGERSASGLI